MSEFLLSILIAVLFSGVSAYVFYRSFIAFIILFFVSSFAAPFLLRIELKKRRDERLGMEFKDTIVSLSGYLSAGYSAENAFLEVYREKVKQGDRRSLMELELRNIVNGIGLNKNIEVLLMELAERSGNEDIESFALVFSLAKRNGGDMKEIIDRSVGVIRDKAQVMEDIKTSVRGVKYEQSVMTAIPFFIVSYIDLTSPEFMSPLYESISGRCIMTLGLCMIAGAFLLSNKITNIDV